MLRTWTARLAEAWLSDYLGQVRASVIRHLRAIPGFAGAEFASRNLDAAGAGFRIVEHQPPHGMRFIRVVNEFSR